ncbi:cytochrome P450 family protein [Saccharothrix xinjiangensis]|uniref:Cytochrome P450 n=1 Tax=Saccharothrix xinjiangensis TaxID=204798 RepID=A0ABV9Y5X2_9PSEU
MTETTGTQLPEMRFDPEFYRDPYPGYAERRDQGPVHRATMPMGLDMWVVTRYEDVKAALGNPALSRDYRVYGEVLDRKLGNSSARVASASAFDAHMLNSDPPDHTRLRRLVGKAFTVRTTERLRPRVQELTGDLLDAMASRGEADLIAEFALPLPIMVICELLGVPLPDQARFREMFEAIFSNSARPEDRGRAARELTGYLTDLIAAKRADPREDLLSELVAVRDGSDRLSEHELMSMAFLLIAAGHETTVNLIGNGALALLTHPEQLSAVRADPELMPRAVEEFLRYDSPVHMASVRVATSPLHIGGVEIPAGELVLLSLAAADRDPERFPDPDTLDVTRDAKGHLAFGHGIHHCIGAHLGRVEGIVALGMLVERFPGLRLAVPVGELRWNHNILFRGVEELPVVL